ncbi:TPA: hypothetical protein NIE12_000940 [Pseudomonas aeruginosa]|nr:hypothetical protein [Pseudomonas aeruginosa]
MTESKICTCPSGDGSLRWPCPAHPAVDQADVAAKLTFINGRPAMCGCQVEYSDGGGEYSDVIYVTLCAKHSGSAILDLVATNRIALTPEYEGQWHADLYLDREIPLAKVEGATPAEAVLALMSAERIDPEQESVEQASGDERAAFRPAQVISYRPGVGEVTIYVAGRVPGYMNIGDTVYVSDRAPVEQPSAALARVAELETALTPFAAVADAYDDSEDDDHEPYTDMGCDDRLCLTLGQHRAARTALSGAPAQAQHLHDLDKQCRDDVARALGLRPSHERGFAWSYLLASIKSCVKAAEAQHSVPEASEQEKEQGWTLDYSFVERVTDLAASRTEYTTSMEATEQVLLAARELLAAAPGKEVGHE